METFTADMALLRCLGVSEVNLPSQVIVWIIPTTKQYALSAAKMHIQLMSLFSTLLVVENSLKHTLLSNSLVFQTKYFQ